MAIVTTPGSASANSYVTVAELRTYASERPHASTVPTADADAEKYLIYGTRLLDTNVPRGVITNIDGALLWPRKWVKKKHQDYVVYYGDNTIPQPLKDGLCELALDLIDNDVAAVSDMAGFKKVKIDTLMFEANPGTERSIYSDTVILYIDHLFYEIKGGKEINYRVRRA